MMRRNLVFGLLFVVAMSTAHAQQSGKVYRIAVVYPATDPRAGWFTETTRDPLPLGFFSELHRLGYFEGKNILIERYSGEGRVQHHTDLARDVVRRNPDLIIAITTYVTLDFKAATTTIPIVGAFSIPVEMGVAPSLAHPGGNVTGASVEAAGLLWSKRLQLFHEMAP